MRITSELTCDSEFRMFCSMRTHQQSVLRWELHVSLDVDFATGGLWLQCGLPRATGAGAGERRRERYSVLPVEQSARRRVSTLRARAGATSTATCDCEQQRARGRVVSWPVVYRSASTSASATDSSGRQSDRRTHCARELSAEAHRRERRVARVAQRFAPAHRQWPPHRHWQWSLSENQQSGRGLRATPLHDSYQMRRTQRAIIRTNSPHTIAVATIQKFISSPAFEWFYRFHFIGELRGWFS